MFFPVFNPQSAICNLQFLLLLFLLLGPTPAFAHKLHVFALANGATIEGEVYAAGNTPIRNAAVRVLGPGDERLGQTTSDEEGKFRFDARRRVDHTFVVEAGEGHTAKYTVPADELPFDLMSDAPAGEVPAAVVKEDPVTEEQRPATDTPAATWATAEIQKELKAIHAQVLQLRKQIDAYEQKTRLHDILGGLGMILGLMGLSFYFLGARKLQKHP